VLALERLVELGVFAKGAPRPGASIQYWPANRPSPRDWPHVAGLIHQASRFVGTRGLRVMRGRVGEEVVYAYNPAEDR